MSRRRLLDSVVWGLLGGLVFLLGSRLFEAVAEPGIDPAVKVGVAVLLVAVVSVTVHRLRPRLRRNERP